MESANERAARYSDLFAEGHEHAAECAYCPICATIAVVRRTNPEVLDHLAGAARELLAAAGKLIEEAEKVVGNPPETVAEQGDPQPSGPRSSRRSGDEAKVRRIDIV